MTVTKRILILMSVSFFSLNAVAQSDSTKIQDGKHGNLVAYLYELRQMSGEDTIEHVDSIAGYSLVIPKWWRIRETPTNTLFGGTFPAINKVENALIFKTYNKSEFKNIKAFDTWVISDYKMGDTPKWSNSHKIMLKKEQDDFKNLGKSYKVQIMRNGYLYSCFYIIIETSNSYLWIDFTATKETFALNFPKLKEIMSNYNTL